VRVHAQQENGTSFSCYFVAPSLSTKWHLISCYEHGEGVAQDWAEAVRFYRMAAEQGNAKAQVTLGVCFKRGEGVAQDWAEAVRYYRLAAEQGHFHAQFNLGGCFEHGEGVAQDWAEAVRYYRLAAEQGHADAQCNLGSCYKDGEGVAQDWAEAVRYYRLAAEQGHAGAQSSLGICFEIGAEGVAQDLAEAVRYYRLAISQADALSADELARMTAACDRIACSREVASTCCLGCGARRKLKTCAKCKMARFCGTECVARAWPAHQPNCRLWRNGNRNAA
jgi:hypothetical protein